MIELYFKSIIRRWKKEIQIADSEVIIFSPFLTSETAERVITEADPSQCTIYTNFNIEYFASGASSIKTIKNLIDLGYKVYHINQLHAKVLYIPNSFVSIGSQNLTYGGTIKREATIILSDISEIKDIERLISDWVSARLLINNEMIEFVELLLPDLRKSYIEFKNQLEKTTKLVEKYIDKWDIYSKIKKINQRIDAILMNGSVPEYLARRFIANSAWWLTHYRGPVRAAGHSANIYGQEPDWKIDFGANTFLVGKAILRCTKTIRKFLIELEDGTNKSKEKLRQSLIYDVRSSVLNYEGTEYFLYPVDEDNMKFGAQAINVKDFTNLIFEIYKINDLFENNNITE